MCVCVCVCVLIAFIVTGEKQQNPPYHVSHAYTLHTIHCRKRLEFLMSYLMLVVAAALLNFSFDIASSNAHEIEGTLATVRASVCAQVYVCAYS
jgi:hypothetical protein